MKQPFAFTSKNKDGRTEHFLVRFLTLRVANTGKAVAEDCFPFAQLLNPLKAGKSTDYPYPLRWAHHLFDLTMNDAPIELKPEEQVFPKLLSCCEKQMSVIQNTTQPLNVLFTVEDTETHLFSSHLVTDSFTEVSNIFDIAFMVASKTPNASKSGIRFRIFLKSADDFDVARVTLWTLFKNVFSKSAVH